MMVMTAMLLVLTGLLVPSVANAQGPPQAGPATEINAQIIGLSSINNIPLTALPNQTSYMSPQFEIIMRSPGNSTYTISADGSQIYSGYFSYIKTIVDLNSTLIGLYVLSFNIFSSALGISVSFNYSLDFITVTNYIHYVSQQLHIIVLEFTTGDLESFGFAIALLMGIMIPSFTVLLYRYKKSKRSPLQLYAGDDFRHREMYGDDKK
ncbi:MAG: hypothetical protein KIS29_09820 [Thermoplasmata archaeon]|nr:hypothetical protein [Candidatus Sysuiplasma jiujiangense]